MADKAHAWRFRRIGGMDQVVLKTGDDIASLTELDPKLWVALAMPAAQQQCREVLALLDADSDGKVRVPELLGAVAKCQDAFANLDSLFDETSAISVEMLRNESLRASCAYAAELAGVGTDRVDLGAVELATSRYSVKPFNGDGVIVPESSADKALAAAIAAIIGSGYQTPDSSGTPGLSQANLDVFIADAKALLAWTDAGATLAKNLPSAPFESILPAYQAIASAVDDYFRRCAVLNLAGNQDALKDLSAQMAAMLAASPSEGGESLQKLPLALPRADGLLALDAAFNPLFADAANALFSALKTAYALAPTIDRSAWARIAADMNRYAGWLSQRPSGGVGTLPQELLGSALTETTTAALGALIEKDLAEGPRAQGLRELRDIMILKRDLLKILRNFVSMDEFYGRHKGLFQSGRLYIDGRELELCLEVRNPAAHATLAGFSAICLLYCDIARTTGEKASIVAALTAGAADRVYIGRNGIYFDEDGKDWNATITKVVIQPVSIREAFLSPYKWLARTIEEFAARRAGAAEANRQNQLKDVAQKTVEQPAKTAQPAEQVVPKKVDVGTVAAIGVALGSIGAMITSILGLFIGMGVWMPIGIVVVFLLISGPSMILAAIKLRRRDLSPLLNAEGWAINGRLKLNIPFGATLSHLAQLPPNSIRTMNDPYAPKRKPWGLYIAVLIVALLAVAYLLGWLNPVIALFAR